MHFVNNSVGATTLYDTINSQSSYMLLSLPRTAHQAIFKKKNLNPTEQ